MPLPLWVVYDHPADYPDRFVARRWDGATPLPELLASQDLDALRNVLRSYGLVRIARDPADDPKILEVWL